MIDQTETVAVGHRQPVWLDKLLAGICTISDDENRLIASLELSSHKILPGNLFIALPGLTADGRDYIDQSIENGAAAVLYEPEGMKRELPENRDVPVIPVANLKKQLGIIASRIFQDPSMDLKITGITGTNGKTTTAYLLTQAIEALGNRCGYSGTLGSGVLGKLESSDLTTSDVVKMHRQLAQFRDSGATAACLEISSHGLDQGRANAVQFDVAVFTNLSQDHLDYHHSMERYAEAKRKLFEFDSLTAAVVNMDDSFGRELYEFCKSRSQLNCITYGIDSGDLQPSDLEVDDQGIRFSLSYQERSWKLASRILGIINVPNILACIGALLGLGYEMKRIVEIVPVLTAPPGRMEIFKGAANSATVVVDYAHTPDALQRSLSSLRQLCRGSLTVVFGCGGDRDQGKRPLMGGIAEQLADRVILTDDNPRTEPPELIIEQIQSGMSGAALAIHDRPEAIREALRGLTETDIVLVAGKGHELTQTIGDTTKLLSDRSIVQQTFGEMS